MPAQNCAAGGAGPFAFDWTAQRERAAALVAEDRLTDAAIAAEVGCSRRTITTWKAHPGFRAGVIGHVADTRRALVAQGVGSKLYRLWLLNDAVERLVGVLRARARDKALADVPGGALGLLVRKGVRYLPTDDGFEPWFEHAVDTGLLRELRECLKQAAQEVGDWSERYELSGAGVGPVRVVEDDLSTLSDDELDDELARINARLDAASRTGAGTPPPGLVERPSAEGG